MKIITKLVLCLALCLLFTTFASAQKKAFLTEGTFSNITVGGGGDYGGMQIYVTDSDGQFYVVVTIAEGIKKAPVMVKAKVNIEERKLDFTLPGAGGRKFTAVVMADGMSLFEITTTKTADGMKLAENEEQFLKRICQK